MSSRIILIALLLLAIPLCAQEKMTDVTIKKIEVSDEPAVKINAEFCNILVQGQNTNKALVLVEVAATAATKEEASRLAEKAARVDLDGSRDAISVTVDFRGNNNDDEKISIVIRVNIPHGSHIEVSNKFGTIQVTDIQGGTIIQGKHGEVSITNGRSATVTNQFGSINLASMSGMVEASMKHGSVQCHGFKGGRIANEFGSITLSGIGGYVEVRNRMGSIEAVGMRDGLIENQYGNINLKLDKSFSGDIRAGSTYGSIQTNLKLKKREKGNDVLVEGKVGNGDDKLMLQNKFGNITIDR